jgi:hypothetical protein
VFALESSHPTSTTRSLRVRLSALFPSSQSLGAVDPFPIEKTSQILFFFVFMDG